jgi:hypothetical protein
MLRTLELWQVRSAGTVLGASLRTCLGPLGNSIADALGGGVLGQIINALLGIGGTSAASGLDISSIVSAFVTGGVGGGITTLVVAYLKAKLTR